MSKRRPRVDNALPPNQPPGLMQLVPTNLDIGLTDISMLTGLTPWGSVRVMGLSGTGVDGLRHVVIASDWPMPYLDGVDRLQKSEVEFLHLSTYMTDWLNAIGKSRYDLIEPGGNPPDFVCSRNGFQIGVECTSFTIERRRLVNGLFKAIRAAAFREDRDHFPGIQACTVYMWFDSSVKSLPPSVFETGKVAQIVTALSEYRADFGGLIVPYGETPEKAPNLSLQRVAQGCTFYAAPMAGDPPASNFYRRLGFEVGVAYTTRHSAATGWQELQRLIAAHDNQDVQDLLVTVGGPDAGGLGYLSEEVLMDFLLAAPLAVPRPSHIATVTLHFWSSGRIVEVFPSSKVISEGRPQV